MTGAALRLSAEKLEHLGPTLFSPLITHRADLETGADLMNRMIATDSRHLADGPVIRLVVTVNAGLETDTTRPQTGSRPAHPVDQTGRASQPGPSNQVGIR